MKLLTYILHIWCAIILVAPQLVNAIVISNTIPHIIPTRHLRVNLYYDQGSLFTPDRVNLAYVVDPVYGPLAHKPFNSDDCFIWNLDAFRNPYHLEVSYPDPSTGQLVRVRRHHPVFDTEGFELTLDHGQVELRRGTTRLYCSPKDYQLELFPDRPQIQTPYPPFAV